jgi:hypothetical protein
VVDFGRLELSEVFSVAKARLYYLNFENRERKVKTIAIANDPASAVMLYCLVSRV